MITLQMNKISFLLKILPFQYKEEFSSTAEIVQTIQTMTANLVKVMIINNIIFFMNTRFYRLMIQHVSFKFLCLSFYCLTLFITLILTQSYIFFPLCVQAKEAYYARCQEVEKSRKDGSGTKDVEKVC